MPRRQLLVTNSVLLIIIIFIFAWALFEKNEHFYTLFGINFIIIGVVNFLFCVTLYKEKKKGLASVYFVIALSFWVLSLVNFGL